ncbi:MAG: YcxB family protein [Enterococcus sp.]|nr:YcxB family protein [Enterococcus sp.]
MDALFKNTYTQNFDNTREFLTKIQRPGLLILSFIPLGVGIWQIIDGSTFAGVIFCIVCAGMMFVHFTAPTLNAKKMVNFLNEQGHYPMDIETSFFDDKFQCYNTSTKYRQKYSYDDVIDTIETKNLFVLKTKERQGNIMLEKSRFDGKDFQEFKAFIQGKVSK